MKNIQEDELYGKCGKTDRSFSAAPGYTGCPGGLVKKDDTDEKTGSILHFAV
jgi:hypothetical protein